VSHLSQKLRRRLAFDVGKVLWQNLELFVTQLDKITEG
jgi:hypothetical protein